jgi:peptide methionine sulfoxide reductase msrA/msrB
MIGPHRVVLSLALCLWCLACSRPAPSPSSSTTASEAAASGAGAPQLGSAFAERQSRTPGAPSEGNVTSPSGPQETAILAGGCFWGMEELLRKIPGVLGTDVGYVGGTTAAPDYEAVHSGTTGHAEAVRVVFDPTRLSYETLLEKWYFRMHDPTTKNRQGNDLGSQYRSAIFFTSPEQQGTAVRVKERVDKSGKWAAPLVTEIVPAGTVTLAEDYHQDYLQANPDGYTCHYLRD